MATTTIGAPGVTFPDGSVQASKGASGDVVMSVYTSSSTWTKPATVKSIKVTVVGGGGNGGTAVSAPTGPVSFNQGSGSGGGGGGTAIRVYLASSIPGPQPFTVGGAGGTSSFGSTVTVISATGGGSGTSASGPQFITGASGGVGSGGMLNINGSAGGQAIAATSTTPASGIYSGFGGSSSLGGGAVNRISPQVNASGVPGGAYGGGGSGGISAGGSASTNPGGTGAPGVVIIEEFY